MKLLLAATVDNWNALAPSRQDQHFRNTLAEAVRRAAEQIQNHGSVADGLNWPGVSLHFKLEPSSVAKPADGEQAA